MLKLATKFKTALLLSSGNSSGIHQLVKGKIVIIKSQSFASISFCPIYFFFHDRLQRSTQKLVDTCHVDETHTASSDLTVCKSYKMRSDEISAISPVIPLQCPIDRAILDCKNIENEEVTQEITIFTSGQIQDVDQMQYKSHGT